MFIWIDVVCMHYMITGYRYGKSLIPISDADEQAMKLQVPRCLSLLGFTNMEKVRQYQTIGTSVQVLIADPADEVCLDRNSKNYSE